MGPNRNITDVFVVFFQVSPPCGAVPNITNGSPDQNSNTSVGAQVIYTCDSNYQFPDLSKMLSIECQSNSTWSGPLWDACQGSAIN